MDASELKTIRKDRREKGNNLIQSTALFSGSIKGGIGSVNLISSLAASIGSPGAATIAAGTFFAGATALSMAIATPILVCVGSSMMAYRSIQSYNVANKEIKNLKDQLNSNPNDNDIKNKIKAHTQKRVQARNKIAVGAGLFLVGTAMAGSIVATGGLAIVPIVVGSVGMTVAAGGLSANVNKSAKPKIEVTV